MVIAKRIFYKNGFYSLKKHSTPKVSEIYNSKLKTAKHAVFFLSFIPTIKLVAISGSTAAGRPKASSDIDLFVICASNTVWITRFFCVCILFTAGIKRLRGTHKVTNKICLNMFLDINNINILSKNIYTARETMQIIPLLNRKHSYERFISSNKWATKVFPNSVLKMPINLGYKTPALIIEKFISRIIFPFSWIFFAFQYFYMRNRITKETVTFNEIRFHPIDYQSIILRKFAQNIRSENIELLDKDKRIFFSDSLDKRN